jgi:hypothetical protein
MILIGGDCSEFRLWEDESAKVLCLRGVFCALVDVNNVETRLVAVHGIEYNLHNTKTQREGGS